MEKSNKIIIVLSIVLVISIFLNVMQFLNLKQMERDFEILEQRYVELLEEIK